MNTYQPEFYRKTYEYEANPLSHEFPPYNSIKDPSYKTSQEKFSNSPPIILCEFGGSRNNKTHKHKYLFYPSASRLSPFTDNNNNYLNNYNIIKSTLRDENNLSGEIGNKKNLINNNETSLNQNEKSPEKYQAMYDKSFELVKRISELVPEENIKLKGNSDYYLAKDKDYMNIIDNEIDSLTNHFKNNNYNLGYKTDVNINKNSNSNLNPPNDENQMTYDQYKNNLLQRIKNTNKEINLKEFNYNYKENNIEENKDFKNNMENEFNNNRNYINDYINEKNNQNDQKKENIEINEPEIQYKNILRNKNLKENNNINVNNRYNNKEEEKYINKNDENNHNMINNENDQLMNNNIENELNQNDNQKKEEPLINTNDKKISQSTKYNTLGMIQGTNDNFNINPSQNQYQPLDNNINTNNNPKYESNNLNKEYEDPNTNTFPPYQLVDEKNNKMILSPEGKPFKGELVENQYQKGNQIFIKTKSGSDIKLSILRSKEGEPLTYKGYPLMGNDQKFFYDKNGNIIVYPDNEFIKGDKAVEVGIQNPNDKNNLVEFCINKNNFDLFGTDNREEFRGSGNGGFKKSKKKNKWYMFPKGDGGAKAPIIRKKKKRRSKK